MLKEVMGPLKSVGLTETDVKNLWTAFSNALREHGMDPNEYKELFNIMIVRSKSYEENLRWMLEEIKSLRGYAREG